MRLFRKKNKEKDSIKKIENKESEATLEEAIAFIQEEMIRTTIIDDKTVEYNEKQHILSLAMSRDREAIKKSKYYIKRTLENSNIYLKGYNSTELSELIFAKNWGLDGLERYAIDNSTDEIRVNKFNQIRIVKNGIPQKVNFKFENESEIENIIKRLIIEDLGSSIDRSNPSIEAVLADGSRLTATCPPISSSWTFILRRPASFIPTLENYIKRETLDIKVWEAISLLARGRASILYSGNVGAGKTTFMRKVAGELNEKLRIGVIGKDSEVLLSNEYPNKDIIELQEQEHLGIKMKDLFVLMLRESPDVLIMEEFRGAGEAVEAVRACTRGLDGSMATAHFNTAEEAIEGMALFMLEEGLTVPIDMAKLRVARAFNIIVQMEADALTGKKKIIEVMEIGADKEGQIYYNQLIRWMPEKDDDYFGKGEWFFTNKPTDKLIYKLLKGVGKDELIKMGWL